jgi:CheY-like chemotaxis protein
MNKPLSGRRILVVDDEMLIRITIEDVLADLGCESVIAAATTEMAVALVDEQVFDAAVLDINLNGTSSRIVADALAARGVPFVIATGNRGEVWEGFRDRAVLRKPFKYDQLVESLASLLPR